MTETPDRPVPDPMELSLRTQLPNLGDELQRAIHTLQKLRAITGTLDGGASGSPGKLDLRSPANPDGTVELSGGSPAPANLAGPTPAAQIPSGEHVRMMAAGETFGRYQISRPLGRGAMGAVYLAYDAQLQRYVALKTPFLGDNPQVVQRFFREARSAAQIRSPYVCPIYEVDNVAGILYLSMAFIEGRSLAQWIHEDEPHTLDEILVVFRKIASGIQKAHAHGIIHRDLKPQNIMIDTDGEPIIMDFGLARRVHEDVQVTAAGGLLGTPAYMSPEQVSGDHESVGHQSDLYSLGVVLYEMLTRAVPFNGPLMTVLHKIATEEPVPPSVRQPDIAPGSPIEQINLKMMAKDRAERYQRVTEVLKAMDRLSTAQPSLLAPPSRSLLRAAWQKSGKIFASLVGNTPPPPAPETDMDAQATTAPLMSEDTSAADESVAETMWQPRVESAPNT